MYTIWFSVLINLLFNCFVCCCFLRKKKSITQQFFLFSFINTCYENMIISDTVSYDKCFIYMS